MIWTNLDYAQREEQRSHEKTFDTSANVPARNKLWLIHLEPLWMKNRPTVIVKNTHERLRLRCSTQHLFFLLVVLYYDDFKIFTMTRHQREYWIAMEINSVHLDAKHMFNAFVMSQFNSLLLRIHRDAACYVGHTQDCIDAQAFLQLLFVFHLTRCRAWRWKRVLYCCQHPP